MSKNTEAMCLKLSYSIDLLKLALDMKSTLTKEEMLAIRKSLKEVRNYLRDMEDKTNED